MSPTRSNRATAASAMASPRTTKLSRASLPEAMAVTRACRAGSAVTVVPHLDSHVLTKISAFERAHLAQVPFLGKHHGDRAIRRCHPVEAVTGHGEGGVQVIEPGPNVDDRHEGNHG